MPGPREFFSSLRDAAAERRAAVREALAERSDRSRGGAEGVAPLRVSWLALVVVGVVVIGGFALAPSLGLLIEQRQQIAALQDRLAEQQQNVDELQSNVARWDDPSYIEAQARDRLFYVYPGETSFVVLDDRTTVGAAETTVDFSSTLERTKVDWMQSTLGSLVIAGLTDAPADALSGSGSVIEPTPTATPAPSDPAAEDDGEQ